MLLSYENDHALRLLVPVKSQRPKERYVRGNDLHDLAISAQISREFLLYIEYYRRLCDQRLKYFLSALVYLGFGVMFMKCRPLRKETPHCVFVASVRAFLGGGVDLNNVRFPRNSPRAPLNSATSALSSRWINTILAASVAFKTPLDGVVQL